VTYYWGYYWVIASALIFVITFLIWRYVGWKWLVVIWLAGTVVLSVTFVSPTGWARVASDAGNWASVVALIFGVNLAISGWLVYFAALLAWAVAVYQRWPQRGSVTEMADFADLKSAETGEDEHRLSHLLWCYDDLLETHVTALNEVRFHPYHRVLRGLRHSWDPRYAPQARAFILHLYQVPNILRRDLIGAEVVLAKLGELTTGQLAAIEACHRINQRRVHQRFILPVFAKKAIPAVVISSIGGLIPVVEKAGQVVGIKWPEVWSSIVASRVSWLDGLIIMTLPATIVLMAVILNAITSRPILRRLQAFADILTIAIAYRKGLGETAKPSAESSLTATG
jgi:hypothetical protein